MKTDHTQSFDLEQLKKYLSDPQIPISYYPSVSSTNTLLKQAAADGAPHLQAILASHQQSGRGRMGRSFYSPSDSGLYLSILYDHDKNPALANYLTMAAGVAVFTAIRDVFGIETSLKWVNDLYLNGRKIAGILAEGSYCSSKRTTVLGIGINLFEPTGGFPPEIADIAGALFADPTECPTEKRYTFIAVLIDNLRALAESKGSEKYIALYREHSWVLGKKVVLQIGNDNITGIVRDFNPMGHLILEKENGEIETFSGGEISLRIKDLQKSVKC